MHGCTAQIKCCTARMHRRRGPVYSRTARIAARTARTAACTARMNTRTPRMPPRPAQMYCCLPGTRASRAAMHARIVGLYGRTGAIVARRAATRAVTAVLSLAHERMPRSNGYRSGVAGRTSIKTDGSHGTAKAFSGSPATSPLHTEDADHTFAPGPTAPDATKQSHGDVSSPSPHWFTSLGHRADAHGGRSHFARHTTRSKGQMRFLQNAVLAALKHVQPYSTTMPRYSPRLSISPPLGNGSTLSSRASPTTRTIRTRTIVVSKVRPRSSTSSASSFAENG